MAYDIYVMREKDGIGPIIDIMITNNENPFSIEEVLAFHKKWEIHGKAYFHGNKLIATERPFPALVYEPEMCSTDSPRDYFWGEDLVAVEKAIQKMQSSGRIKTFSSN